MGIVLSILIMVLILGVLVTVHEAGHFFAAKLSGIRVNEFAIGMGPKIWKKQKGETLYSVRAFPIGGFCAMEGEDGGSEDPRCFGNAKYWKRFVVLIAGSFMNFIVGLLVLMIIALPMTTVIEPVIKNFGKDFPLTDTLQTGDRLVKVNGHAIYQASDVEMFLEMGQGRLFDLVVEREGQRLTFDDVNFPKQMYLREDGSSIRHSGLVYESHDATFGDKISAGWYDTVHYVRLVWVTLGELFNGNAAVTDLMGPVGMGSVVNQIVERPEATTKEKALNVLDFLALIAVNLAVMNMLPLPALDGGRILFMVIGMIRRKPLPSKAEGYVNAASFVLLMGLMVFVFFNDILRLFGVAI